MSVIPKQLQKEENRFILIDPTDKNMKKPLEINWQEKNNYPYNHPKLVSHIVKGFNYGVATGHGGLLVVDWDNESFRQEYEHKLPETFTVKTGGGGFHSYYYCDNPESFKILDTQKNTLADIQGWKKQVIGVGSTHKTGKKYEITKDIQINKIKINHLKVLFSAYLNQKNKLKPKNQFGDLVDQIKNKVSIVDLMNDYGYDLTKNPTMCKLGHPSKGGSCFSFNTADDLFYCFHCDKGGSIFDLYMEHENCNFKIALGQLAERAGISPMKKSVVSAYFITNYLDNVNKLHSVRPFFYDRQEMFWLWDYDNNKWVLSNPTDLMNDLEEELRLNGQTVTSKTKANYIEALRRVGRKKIPSTAPKSWIQFNDVVFDVKTGKSFKVRPDFFVCNPIPWSIGENSDTPVMDVLFEEWVGKEYVQTLYEILAYCCLPDYPIHLIFCLVGCGRNGKSKFLGLLKKFIGGDNICSTELDSLTSCRFESFKLFKKTACLLGETNFGTLSRTSMIKKLTGQDLIGFEMKNKQPFDGENYAKIIVASNSLPTSTDTSEGFYRRWLIINFNNTFPEGHDVLKKIPQGEYGALAKKVTEILPSLLKRGKITGQGSIEDRKEAYIMASNPIPYFIHHFCEVGPYNWVLYNTFYKAYVHYLLENKKRKVSRKEFKEAMSNEGFWLSKAEKQDSAGNYVNGWMFEGIQLKNDVPDFSAFLTNIPT